ncbi:DUF4003 family protein [Bacillus sp. REN10]|uniref:DUF4003 family protein n=1 Tax=Bacillus sp. REN10 TaxID=2782541 RepID=UPI00193B203A|nr:DUF4003 family protein [Bacillus sp. REN10]
MNQAGNVQTATTFVADYEKLVDAVSWGADKRQLLFIVCQYHSIGQRFDPKSYLQLLNYIKKQVTWMSPLRTSFNYSFTAMLLTNFKDPYQSFEEVQSCYRLLLDKGFRKSSYTYIAATVAVLTPAECTMDMSKCATRAMAIYKQMKKEHFFLTSYEDYPLAILLAKCEGNHHGLMNEIEYYYGALSEGPFRAGNDLQFLTHILAQGSFHNRPLLAERATHWFESLRDEGVKIKGIHYPIIGILALLATPDQLMDEIMTLYHVFKGEKLFKWYQEMSLLIAAQLVIKEKMQDSSVVTAGLAVSIEAILQAQQAAMFAAIAAATAPSSATSSS